MQVKYKWYKVLCLSQSRPMIYKAFLSRLHLQFMCKGWVHVHDRWCIITIMITFNYRINCTQCISELKQNGNSKITSSSVYLVVCIWLLNSGSSKHFTIGSVWAWRYFNCVTTSVLFSTSSTETNKRYLSVKQSTGTSLLQYTLLTDILCC